MHRSIAHLSKLSLGCATFGREIDAPAAFALMDHAIDRGIVHFDTAASYSAGASEQIVGHWLATQKSSVRPSVATKIKPPYIAETIVTATQASKQRLGVESIDLLYLHQWSDELLHPAPLLALQSLIDDGIIRSLGVSNFTADHLRQLLHVQQALGLDPIRALQNNLNFAVRDIDEDIREQCVRADIAIITYSPLGAGFLTGKHLQGVVPGSRFDVIPGHQRIYFTPQAEQRLARLTAIARKHSLSNEMVALVWTLNQPGTRSVLVGGRKVGQIDQAVAALSLGPAEWLSALNAE